MIAAQPGKATRCIWPALKAVPSVANGVKIGICKPRNSIGFYDRLYLFAMNIFNIEIGRKIFCA